MKMVERPILEKKYELLCVLGEGACAVVKQARSKKSGELVAVKILIDDAKRQEAKDEDEIILDQRILFEHEIKVMQKIRQSFPEHRNIMQLIEVCQTQLPPQPCLVVELLHGGELFDRIVERNHYTEADAAKTFRYLISALADLHSIGIIHRDLKPENILYGATDRDIKIVDFGTAQIMGEEDSDPYRGYRLGSAGYTAPEAIRRVWSPGCDIWSMGCILYCLLVGYMPFDIDDPAYAYNVLIGKFEFHEENWRLISEEAKDLIRRMLSVSLTNRIKTNEVLSHRWFVLQNRRPSVQNLGLTLVRMKDFKKKTLANRAADAAFRAHQMINHAISRGLATLQNTRRDASKSGSGNSFAVRVFKTLRGQGSKMITDKSQKAKTFKGVKDRQQLMSDIRSSKRFENKEKGGFTEKMVKVPSL